MGRPRRPPAAVAALRAAGLLGSGLGALVLAGSLPGARAVVEGRNVPVNVGAMDAQDVRANNTPSVARNPDRPGELAVANRVDSPSFSCALHVSTDGGGRWQERTIPFPEGEEAPPRCYAPDVVYDAGGTLHASFVTLAGNGNVPNAVWVTSSTDGGRTLSTPRRVLGRLAFQTRLVADPVGAGRLHLSYLQAAETGTLSFPSAGNPVRMVSSDDGGRTWSEPATVNDPGRQRVVAPAPAAGPAGELYLAYLDVRDDVLDYHGAHGGRGGDPYPGRWSLVLARSGDGGASWRETVVDDGLVPTQRFVVFLPPAPSVAVDRGSGRVYVAFHDGRLGDADVWLWASADRGRTFGPPTRVNDNRRRDGTTQYLPAVSVAPGGRVDVVYYDRRSDPDDVRNDATFQFSGDHGASFEPAVRLSERSFDSRIGFGSERGMAELGSRLALLSGDGGALAVWTDTRAGTRASGKQDLASVTVTVAGRSPWRGPLRAGGTLLVLAAAAVAAPALAGRRRNARAARSGLAGGEAAPGGPAVGP